MGGSRGQVYKRAKNTAAKLGRRIIKMVARDTLQLFWCFGEPHGYSRPGASDRTNNNQLGAIKLAWAGSSI